MKTLEQNLRKIATSALAVLAVAPIFVCSAKAQDDQQGAQSGSGDSGYSQIGNGLFIPNQAPAIPNATQAYQPVGNGLFLEVPSAMTPNTDEALLRSMMIGNDRRLAVVYECWYALRQSWLNPFNQPTLPSAGPSGGKSINGNVVSDWNYLSPAADQNSNALRFAVSTYQYDTEWSIPTPSKRPTPPMSSATINQWVSIISNDNYGLGYGSSGYGYGHGCQCVSFASMIIYRALGGTRFVWKYPRDSKGNPLPYPSATSAQPGDIVFYDGGTPSTVHVAICVGVSRNSVTVVDSNFVSFLGQTEQEIIARHTVLLNTNGVDSHKHRWERYSGSGYWY